MVYTYSEWSIWLQTSDSGLLNTGKTTVYSSSILVRLARGAIPCLLYMFNRPSVLQQCCYTSVHVAGWAGVISSDKWVSVIQGRVTNFQWFNCIEMWFHTSCMLTYSMYVCTMTKYLHTHLHIAVTYVCINILCASYHGNGILCNLHCIHAYTVGIMYVLKYVQVQGTSMNAVNQTMAHTYVHTHTDQDGSAYIYVHTHIRNTQ